MYYHPSEITADLLEASLDNIKADRTAEDLLFQAMLEIGVLPSGMIELNTIHGKDVYTIFVGDEKFLMACFDKDITDTTITAIAKYEPYYFVTRDSSLGGDDVACNFEQIFATYCPTTVRKVL